MVGPEDRTRYRLTIRPHGSSHATTVTVEGELSPADLDRLADVLVDPLLESGSWGEPVAPGQLDVGLLPGVTDTAAVQVRHAAGLLGVAVGDVAVGRVLDLGGPVGEREIRRRYANPVIERWAQGEVVEPGFVAATVEVPAAQPVVLPADEAGLVELSRQRGLALDLPELHAVRDHFEALGRPPSDAELETIAQTWSEHCAHKSFRARILVSEGDELEPLLVQLRRTTTEIAAPFVVSAFDGNAGIVAFGPSRTYALKCETHNHPSAVEPFGGANTGVGGVIRDIAGAHHRPIACTDVLCFGPPSTPDHEVPEGVLPPQRIVDGVVAGVADYGNKIGLPTVAGAVLYDPAYVSNPLVFAGCIGAAPADRPALTGPHPGDRVVVLGGRTGRDGLRGATFSSMEMDATTGDVAGASVQIGDPIVEKLVCDLLDEAWPLYTAITDCGAGGLSSAVGELADPVGADVELDRVPLKYQGLAPWETWLSEAQERMVVAVAPERLAELQEAASRRGVEMADLGTFTGSGRLVVRHGGVPVVDLDTAFLHHGRPQRALRADLPVPERAPSVPAAPDARAALLALLAHPNIASKAATVRRYDHEIRGATVVRPLTGVVHDGPSDGVVLVDPGDTEGIVVGIGVNPWYGRLDPEHMAWAVVDEAIRNAVAAGGDPDAVALLDNFSWGSPTRPSTFGELVAAVQGCCAAARHYGAPFVSGKDSLNNEYLAADGARHAIPPTLVITAVAALRDLAHATTSDLKRAGNVLVLCGATRPELGGSHLGLVVGGTGEGAVPAPDASAPARYRAVHDAVRRGLVESAHDCSEGGLAVALAEMCIGGRLGARVDPSPVAADPTVALFAESAGRIVLEVAAASAGEVLALLGPPAVVIGQVVAEPVVVVDGIAAWSLDELVAAFTGEAP